jgi:agmatine deiminase
MKNFIQDNTPQELGYHMPAEWEPHEATWLAWPKDPLTWPDRVPQAQEVFAQMIEALTPGEKVHLLVDDAEAEQKALRILAEKKVFKKNLFLHQIPTVDSWIRDYGPIFVKRSFSSSQPSLSRGKGKLMILDWGFNAWGDKYEELKKDDVIPQKVAPLLDIPVLHPSLVLEGGSIDVNGAGTLLTTEQCLLNPNRNPHLSKPQIEEFLQNYLGVNQIFWLAEGVEGDDTDGHVDDVARFVSTDTVVTVLEEDPQDKNFKALQENLKRLQSFRLPNGKPLKVIPLKMPNPVFSNDGRLPASYANFYIANGVVLVPIFHQDNDEVALSIFSKIFPSRKVVGIFCEDLVWGMGAIHCVTQQQPAGESLGS